MCIYKELKDFELSQFFRRRETLFNERIRSYATALWIFIFFYFGPSSEWLSSRLVYRPLLFSFNFFLHSTSTIKCTFCRSVNAQLLVSLSAKGYTYTSRPATSLPVFAGRLICLSPNGDSKDKLWLDICLPRRLAAMHASVWICVDERKREAERKKEKNELWKCDGRGTRITVAKLN